VGRRWVGELAASSSAAKLRRVVVGSGWLNRADDETKRDETFHAFWPIPNSTCSPVVEVRQHEGYVHTSTFCVDVMQS
jgi:hypothetical protein